MLLNTLLFPAPPGKAVILGIVISSLRATSCFRLYLRVPLPQSAAPVIRSP